MMSQAKVRLFGGFLVVLAVVTLGMGAYFQNEQRQTTQCQAQFNEQFIKQLRERSKITERDREALAELVKSVINADSGEDSRRALKRYLEQKEKSDAERAKSPLPKLPEEPESC